MKKLLLTITFLFFCNTVWGQLVTPPFPYMLNHSHSLIKGMLSWHIAMPHNTGGGVWYPLVGQYPGTLVGGPLWNQVPIDNNHWGHLNFDNTDDYVSLTDSAVFDFPNTTFTVHARFRATTASGTDYIVSKRNLGGGGGGWMIRLNSADGAITARLITVLDNSAGERTTVSTNNNTGIWKSITVIFKSDTVTLANNDVTIYTEGELDQGSRTDGAADPYAACSGTCNLLFGLANGTTGFLDGSISEVIIWNRALTTAEIRSLAKDVLPTRGGLFREIPMVAWQSLIPGLIPQRRSISQ